MAHRVMQAVPMRLFLVMVGLLIAGLFVITGEGSEELEPLFWIRIEFAASFRAHSTNEYHQDIDGAGCAKVTVVTPGVNGYKSMDDVGVYIDFDREGYVGYPHMLQISESTQNWFSQGGLLIEYKVYSSHLNALNQVIGSVHVKYRDDVGLGGADSHLITYAERISLYGNASTYQHQDIRLPGESDYNEYTIDLASQALYRDGMNTQFRVSQLVHPIKAVRFHAGWGEQISIQEIWLGIYQRMESY